MPWTKEFPWPSKSAVPPIKTPKTREVMGMRVAELEVHAKDRCNRERI